MIISMVIMVIINKIFYGQSPIKNDSSSVVELRDLQWSMMTDKALFNSCVILMIWMLIMTWCCCRFSMKLMQVQGFETPHRVQDIYEEGQKLRCKPF